MYIALNHKLVRKIKTDVLSVQMNRKSIVQFSVVGSNAVAQDLVSVLAATALTAGVQSITAGITNPAVPRNLRVKGNQVGVAGNVVIIGTNYKNEEITETIALNGATAVDGNKAFKTIVSISLPVQVNAGTDTVSIGVGNKIGLPYKLELNTVLIAYRNKVRESTAPTVTTSTTELESNTVLLNSALNTTDIDVLLIV